MLDRYMYRSPKFGISPLGGFRENDVLRTEGANDGRTTGIPAMTIALLCSSTKQS